MAFYPQTNVEKEIFFDFPVGLGSGIVFKKQDCALAHSAHAHLSRWRENIDGGIKETSV